MTDRTDGVATYTGELLLLYSGRTDGKREMLQSGCLSGRFSLLHRFSGASSVIRVAMVATIYLDVGWLVWPVGVGFGRFWNSVPAGGGFNEILLVENMNTRALPLCNDDAGAQRTVL